MNDWLLQLQQDVVDALNGDFQFAQIPFVSYRKLVVAREVDKALSFQIGKNVGGTLYVGVMGIVNMPAILDEDANVSTPQTQAFVTIDIVEQPEINFESDNGTQIECEKVARQVRAVLRPLAFIGQGALVGSFSCNEDEAVVAPIDNIDRVYPGCAGYRVGLRIRFSETPLAKTMLPSIGWVGDTFTLTNNTMGATIYYTTDGTFPGPGNYGVKQDGTDGTAVQGTTATVASGTVVRYAAYAANMTGSDVASAIAP